MIVANALHSYAIGQNKVWSADRSQTVGASEVGQCARKVFWLKNEGDPQHAVPRDPGYVDSWGARMRGTVFEDQFWVPAMRAAYGDRLLYAGTEQQTLIKGFLSATPDGLITKLDDGRCVTVECKTADPRTNLTEAKAENVYQTHVQMGLLRELTPHKPTHSILSYTDASFWSEVKEFEIEFDPQIYATAHARAATIMTATSASELKPEGWIAGGRECDYCPFNGACGLARRTVPDGVASIDPQFKAEATDLARRIQRLQSEGQETEVALRAAQEELKERLRAKGVRKIDKVLTWSSVKGRPSYDNKAIREALANCGIDVEQFSRVGEPTDRLQITLPKAGDDQTASAA